MADRELLKRVVAISLGIVLVVAAAVIIVLTRSGGSSSAAPADTAQSELQVSSSAGPAVGSLPSFTATPFPLLSRTKSSPMTTPTTHRVKAPPTPTQPVTSSSSADQRHQAVATWYSDGGHVAITDLQAAARQMNAAYADNADAQQIEEACQAEAGAEAAAQRAGPTPSAADTWDDAETEAQLATDDCTRAGTAADLDKAAGESTASANDAAAAYAEASR